MMKYNRLKRTIFQSFQNIPLSYSYPIPYLKSHNPLCLYIVMAKFLTDMNWTRFPLDWPLYNTVLNHLFKMSFIIMCVSNNGTT